MTSRQKEESRMVTIRELLKFKPKQLPLVLSLTGEQLDLGKTVFATKDDAVMTKHRVAVLPEEWEDFDLSLYLRYRDSLNLEIQYHPRLYSAGVAGGHIFSEASLESFYDLTIIKAVNDSLARVADEAGSDKVVQIQIRPGAVAKREMQKTDETVGTWPDWAAIEFDRDPETGEPTILPWASILEQGRVVAVGETKLEIPSDTVRAIQYATRCDVDWISQLQDYQVATSSRFGFIILNRELIVAEATRVSSGTSTNPGTRAASEDNEFRPRPIQKQFTIESTVSVESGGAPRTAADFEQYKPKRQLSFGTQNSRGEYRKVPRRGKKLSSSLGSLQSSLGRSGTLIRPRVIREGQLEHSPEGILPSTEPADTNLPEPADLSSSGFIAPGTDEEEEELELDDDDSDDGSYAPLANEFDIDRFRIKSFPFPTNDTFDENLMQLAEALFVLIIHASVEDNRTIKSQWAA